MRRGFPAGKTMLKVKKIALEQRPKTLLKCYFFDFQFHFAGWVFLSYLNRFHDQKRIEIINVVGEHAVK